MIWTIVPPILIPLPFNLGILVIFIPFIGGFMPTPLVYIKEFITGSSFFLTGLRGPRFIPRKSDPKIKDPLEKIDLLTEKLSDTDVANYYFLCNELAKLLGVNSFCQTLVKDTNLPPSQKFQAYPNPFTQFITLEKI